MMKINLLKKYVKPHLIEHKIKKTTFLNVLIFSLCTFILLSVYTCIKIDKSFKDDTLKNVQQNVNSIDNDLMDAINKSNYIASNNYITNNTYTNFKNDMSGQYEFSMNVQSFINSMRKIDDTLDGTFVLYTHNNFIYENNVLKNIEHIDISPTYSSCLNATDSTIIWNDAFSEQVNIYGEKIKYLSFYRSLKNLSKNFDLLEGRISYNSILKNLIQSDKSITYFDSYPTKTSDFVISLPTICGKNVTGVINKNDIIKEQTKSIIFLFGLYLFILLLVFKISQMRAAVITQELNSFIEEIQNSDNLLNAVEKINIHNTTEAYIIKHKMKELLEQLNNAHKEIINIKTQKNMAEFELLQSKINPHLLYNSLSMIMWKAIELNDICLKNLVTSMTEYFRAVLNRGENIITIKEELSMTKHYIEINEYSYNLKYNLELNVDDSVLDCHIIKLLLQPFVENAIIHGLNGKKVPGLILISIKKQGDYIIFHICDDGIGMEPEKLRLVQSLDYVSNHKGYGIKNTLNRIKLYYGEDCGITISSTLSVGTEVTIKIKNLSQEDLVTKIHH